MSETSGQPTGDSGWLDHDPADLDRQMADAELSALLDQVDLDIKGWMPNPGDKVYGTVVDITIGSSEYGEYPLLTVQTPSGRLVGVHCFHQVLEKEINRKIASDRLHIGDKIAIAYRGEGEAKGGNNPPHMYRVAVQPAKQ